MMARTAPTSATFILLEPDLEQGAGCRAGISVSTLSVETSSSGSSASTVSPISFNHRDTVPSVTDSPRAGRVTSTPADDAAADGALGAGAAGASSACVPDGLLFRVLLRRNRLRLRLRLGRGLLGRGRGGATLARLTDHGQHGADLGHVVLLEPISSRTPAAGLGISVVNLVGGDLEQWLVGFDGVSDCLQPAGNGAFRDGFAQRRESYFG